MRRTMAKASFLTATNLLFFAIIGTALLALTYQLTHEIIAKSEEQEKLKLIAQILPSGSYDNDIMKDTLRLQDDPLLGNHGETTLYRGRLAGKPSIVVLQAIAPDGYSGQIHLILAVQQDGRLGGVRVVSHKETPGLGDYIEAAKSRWIDIFTELSLANPADAGWKVKKDGGTFEHVAGATVTPRAVIKAVHKALLYVQTHQDKLFSPPPRENAQ